MEILYSIFTLLLFHYVYFIGRVFIGLKRLLYQSYTNESHEKISVIVPLRNEAGNVEQLCSSLSSQTIREEAFEIIFVDDASTDDTVSQVEKFKPENSRIISLPQKESNIARKKKAVLSGIENAQNTIIVVTDADCVHPENWLEIIRKYFDKDTAVVAGPVDLKSGKRLFQKFQRLEFAGLILTGAGLIGINKPIICSAANLAYRKSVFEEVGGFETQLGFSSGDDDLFLQKVASLKKYKLKFALSRGAMVESRVKKKSGDFLEQRKRWASKYLFYENKGIVIQIILLALFYIGLIVQALLGFLLSPYFLYLLAISLIGKLMIEFLVLRFGAKNLYTNKIMNVFLFSELIQIPYIIYAAVAGLFGNFRWKGERVKR